MYVKRTSVFILRDEQGKVLLQHRDENAPTSPNHWGLFGGTIEDNETPDQTLKREAMEELGIELKDIKFFKRYEYLKKGKGMQEKFVYVGPIKHKLEQLRKQQKEGDDIGLFSYEEIKKLKITEHNKIVFKELFDK
tara:strand:- start:86 stop:493 length:408 start_codon:yes stop_codon:yes gene_type:complete